GNEMAAGARALRPRREQRAALPRVARRARGHRTALDGDLPSCVVVRVGPEAAVVGLRPARVAEGLACAVWEGPDGSARFWARARPGRGTGTTTPRGRAAGTEEEGGQPRQPRGGPPHENLMSAVPPSLPPVVSVKATFS